MLNVMEGLMGVSDVQDAGRRRALSVSHVQGDGRG